MKWIEINITTSTSGVEHIESMLLSIGISGWQILDRDEMRSFLDNNPAQWDYIDESLFDDYPESVTVRLYETDNKAGRLMIEKIRTGIDDLQKIHPDIDFGPLPVSVRHAGEDTWLDSWKKYFKPLEIGENIVIKPEWEEYIHTGKIVMNIDPGHVFGTGHHETTRLCIEELEDRIKPGDIMLDLGCGSGILSVIGLLLGAKKCVAVDINRNAVEITRQNAKKNGIAETRLTALYGDILHDRRLRKQVGSHAYDCIVANIVADTIISLSPLIAGMGCLKPEGIFITSGIIDSSLDEVLTGFKNSGYDLIDVRTENDWACVTAKLPKRAQAAELRV